MTKKYDLTDFIDDLTDAFMPMRHVDDESRDRWSALVVRKLSSYSPECLQRALDDLISQRKSKGFPALAELIDACNKAARFFEAQKPRELPIEGQIKPSDAVRAYMAGADTYKTLAANKPQVVIDAAKEGMGGVLKAFVIRKGRLPNSLDEKIEWFSGEDPRSIREEYRKFLEAYELCVKMEAEAPTDPKQEKMMGSWIKLGNFTQWGALRRLGDSMFDKEKARAEWILGAK